MASNFISREANVPPDLELTSESPFAPSPSTSSHSPSTTTTTTPSSTTSGRPSNAGTSFSSLQTHNSSAPLLSPQADLPALPNALLDFLAREPPASNNAHMNLNLPGVGVGVGTSSSSSAHSSRTSSPAMVSGSLPGGRNALSRHQSGQGNVGGLGYGSPSSFESSTMSPTTASYGGSGPTREISPSRQLKSPQMSSSGRTLSAQSLSSPSDQDPTTRTSSSSLQPPPTLTSSTSAIKKSKWPYSFRSRSSDSSSSPSPSTSHPPTPNPNPTTTVHLPTAPPPPLALSTTSVSPIPNSRRLSPTITRTPSSNRMRPNTASGDANRWLLDAQEVQQNVIVGAGGSSKGGVVGLGLDQGRRGGSSGREEREDGREDGDADEDDEEEEEDDVPTPWRSGGERYTHDLGKGDESDRGEHHEEEEDDDDVDEDEDEEGNERYIDAPHGADDHTAEALSAAIGGFGLDQHDPASLHPFPSTSTTSTRDSLPPPLSSDTIFARRRLSNVAAPTLIPDDDVILNPLPTPTPTTDHPAVGAGGLAMVGRSRSETYAVEGREKDKLITTPSVDQLREGMQLGGVGGVLDGETDGPLSAAFEASNRRPSKVSPADFVVAVVGPRHVGKSTVIKRGLKRPAGIIKPEVVLRDERDNRVTVTLAQLVLGGQPRSIEVQEIDSDILTYDSKGVIWPEGLAQCEGAMVCYDATDPNALKPLSSLLNAFWTRGSDVPLIVLACKSHPTQSENATDPVEAAETCNVYGAGIVSLDGGIEDKKAKDSFNWMVRAIMDNRGEVRRPSSSATSHDDHHEEYANRLPTSRAPPVAVTPATLNGRGTGSSPPTTSSREAVTFDNPFGAPPATPTRLVRRESLGLSVVEEPPVATREVSPPASPRQVSSALPGSGQPQTTSPTRQAPDLAKLDLNRHKSSALDLHFSREDMVDKFLFASVTGNDDSYVLLFLIVYRRFARPFDVLGKLIERFEFVAGRLKTDPLLSRFAQMKLCGVLADWFQVYPGDFTAPATFSMLKRFLEGLLPRGATWVANYAIELIPLLRPVQSLHDPEMSWALPDESAVHPSSKHYMQTRRPSVAPSVESAASSGGYDMDPNQSRLSVPNTTTSGLTSHSGNSQPSGNRSRSDSDGATTTGTSDSTDRMGPARKIKTGLGSTSNLIDLSNALMELPEDAIAAQITRIAWESFSQMTPRDLMRHVLAPRDPKNPRALLRDANSNVIRSIDFLNYLADWVATMILVQSKIKYRARIIEKFIHVATSLREQENFDSLMGILAGLNAQPVFRLTETMELVNLKLEGDRTKIPKRLRSLNKLMATTKSFSAYRLALANSGRTMLPYLGVHLQDITVVNEVKSDMRDGQVNWSKFSQMGKSASIVMDCGRNPPVFPIDRGVERCILNVPLLDKDRQYALSYQYQARNVDSNSRTKLRKLVQNLSTS